MNSGEKFGKIMGIVLAIVLGVIVIRDQVQDWTRGSASSYTVHSQPSPTIDPNYVPATPRPRTADEIQAEAVRARQLYIQNAERSFLDKGMDVYLSLKGKQQDELEMKYVLVSRPLVHQMSNNSEFLATVRGLGFRKVVMTDGYQDSWTMDLMK